MLPSWMCIITVHQGHASHPVPGHCEQCRSRHVSLEAFRCIFSLLQAKVYLVAIGLMSHRVTWLGVLFCSTLKKTGDWEGSLWSRKESLKEYIEHRLNNKFVHLRTFGGF